MKVSLFKIGIMLSIVGISWISMVFLQGDRISEEFLLESSNSHKIDMSFAGEDIGYYKVFMPNFSGDEVFVQVLDTVGNVISEQSVHTKMSVAYFDYEKTGKYSVKIVNVSKNPINIQVEFGDTNSKEMIPAGIIILVGSIMIILASYMKLKNYKIAQPDENIS
ncbi:hypothetical protein NsoK4_08065 [Nitrosopumilus sp. K4]|uniref:hypothetical protein n=1 Tax=Nitrosopumilus sp. K4 TaxID=2795383 RepID=UPI001BA7574E|nr:hypothetical protein [Nitrosopumilus sp. K4]QUC64371.1 hypothetical protein NsoK4_08065 [Nitrosopumilus sp. K4]